MTEAVKEAVDIAVGNPNAEEWCEFRPRELFVNRIPEFPEFEETATALGAMHNDRPFWIGDFLNFGESTFGEMYSQVLDLFGEVKYQTAANYKSVMKRVRREVRREDLYFAHHQAVASLKEEEQIHYLRLAADGNLSSKELRQKIREDQGKVTDKPEKTEEDKRIDYMKEGRRNLKKALETETENDVIEPIEAAIEQVDKALWWYGVEVDS